MKIKIKEVEFGGEIDKFCKTKLKNIVKRDVFI
jgi:hypothetical protein